MEASKSQLPVQESASPIKPDELAGQTQTDAGVEPGLTAGQIDLNLRPGVSPVLNDYGSLSVKLGVDHNQFQATTGNLTSLYAESFNSVLKGNVSGVSLDYLAELEKEKKHDEYYAALFNAYFSSISSSAKPSKALSSLRKSLKKAKKLSNVLSMVADFPSTAPEYNDVMEHFSNAISMILHGKGNLQSDKLKAYLDSVTVETKEGDTKPLTALIDGILGAGASSFPDQNTVREQAISAKITADIAMLAQTDSAVNLKSIFERATQFRPISTEVTPQFTNAMTIIDGFKTALDAKRTEMTLAQSDQAVLETVNEENRNVLQLIDTKSAEIRTAKARTTEINDEITRIGTPIPPAQSERVANLQRERRELGEKIEVFETDLKTLRTKAQEKTPESFETKKIAARSTLEFIQLVNNLTGTIQIRIEKLKESGVKLELSSFPQLDGLIKLISSNSAGSDLNSKLVSYLSERVILDIESELVRLKGSLFESRNMTQEEYSMTILTEYYREKYPNYSADSLCLLASSHYIRMQKEHYLQESRRKLLSERADMDLKGVELKGAQELVTLIARERSTSLTDSSHPTEGSTQMSLTEREAIEQIPVDVSLDELRNYVKKNSISMDSLTFLMHNLASYFTPRKLEDGTFVTLSDKEIPNADKLISTLLKLTSEYGALSVLNNKRALIEGKSSLSGPSLLAEALKTYNNEYSEREKNIVIQATSRPSNISSRARLRQVSEEILAQSLEQNVSLEEFENALKMAGVNGFADLQLKEFKRKKGIKDAIDKGKNIAQNVYQFGANVLKLPIRAVRALGSGFQTVGRFAGKVVNFGYNTFKTTLSLPAKLIGGVKSIKDDIMNSVKNVTN